MISQRIAVRRGQLMGLIDQPGSQRRRVDAVDPIKGHISAQAGSLHRHRSRKWHIQALAPMACQDVGQSIKGRAKFASLVAVP